MKPTANILGIFHRKGDPANEHWSGQLDIKALKQVKTEEVNVVFLRASQLPKCILDLAGKSQGMEEALVMMAETNPPATKKSKTPAPLTP